MRHPLQSYLYLACVGLACTLSGCSLFSSKPTPSAPATRSAEKVRLNPTLSNEVVLYALGLLDTGYVFGGSNPSAGLDCSGMVSYIVEQISGKRLPHNAAQIAALTQPVSQSELRPADLVFFNTTGATYSHMGIYMGEGKFIHAPSSKGKVRIERMDNSYFAKRFTGARTLF